MRILITGACGFVGSALFCAAKQHDKFEVYGISYSQKKEGMVCCDLFNALEMRHMMKSIKPDILVHCAWYVKPQDYLYSSINLNWVKAGIDLYRCFYDNGGKRAVFLGSCFEYGIYNTRLHEAAPLAPQNLYASAKAGLGQMLIKQAELDKVSFAWARLFYLYGQRENRIRVIPYIINELLDGRVAQCSHGRQRRDYLFIEDAAAALLAVARSSESGAFNIGSGHPVTLNEIFYGLEKILNGEIVRKEHSLGMRIVEPDQIVANNDRLCSLGWRPKFSLESGLFKTVEWWKQNRQQ
jgi:nucleoside-diphosphate-sugar epimerase